MGMICIPTTSASAKLSAASRKKNALFQNDSRFTCQLGFYQLNPICLQVSQVSPLRNAGFLQLENAHMLCPLSFVFGSHPSLFHGRFCLLLFYSSVANFQQYQPAPIESTPAGLQVPRFPGFSNVQTCLRFNIARVIHLKQFRLGMLQWEFVWSCMFRISFMKTGVYHSDRPFFANINALNKKNVFSTKKTLFRWQKDVQISQIPMLRIVVADSAYLSKLCDLLWWFNSLHPVGHVEASVYISVWFKVCTYPKLIE